MRVVKWILGAVALSFALVAPAWADHGHVRFGVNIGVPFYPWYWGGPGYYYPPAYAYPPAYYYPPVASEPPVYVEQPQQPAAPPQASNAPAPQTGNWYYCESAQGYYPYVKECPSGWRMVPAQPPAPR